MNALIPFAWTAALVSILACSSPSAAQSHTNHPALSSVLQLQGVTASRMVRPHNATLVDDVLRLIESGVDESVVLAFINAADPVKLNNWALATLREHGVSDNFLSSLGAPEVATAANQGDPKSAPISPGSSAILIQTNNPAIARLETPTLQTQPIAPEPNATLTAQRSEPAHAGDLRSTIAPAAPKVQSPPLTAVKKPLYPVREPYPVPITDPFIVLELPSF